MARVKHWERKLDDYIEASRHKPFKWGSHDCALFVAGAFDVLTNSKVQKKYKGKYESEITARRMVKNGLLKEIDKYCPRLINTYLAQRGDIVYYDKALGICLGSKCAFVYSEGLAFIDLGKCKKAWRVE